MGSSGFSRPLRVTALQAAAHSGHIDTLRSLIDRGADSGSIDADTMFGTALVAAIMGTNANVVRFLVQCKVPVNDQVDGGCAHVKGQPLEIALRQAVF